MSGTRHESGDEERLDEATRALIARVRESYGPEPLGPGRRAALERALVRRLEAPRRRLRFVAPALAAAVAAAGAVVWLRPPAAGPAAVPAPAGIAAQPLAAADAQAARRWTAQLFDPPELGAVSTVSDANLYPADLAAIDVAFLQQ